MDAKRESILRLKTHARCHGLSDIEASSYAMLYEKSQEKALTKRQQEEFASLLKKMYSVQYVYIQS